MQLLRTIVEQRTCHPALTISTRHGKQSFDQLKGYKIFQSTEDEKQNRAHGNYSNTNNEHRWPADADSAGADRFLMINTACAAHSGTPLLPAASERGGVQKKKKRPMSVMRSFDICILHGRPIGPLMRPASPMIGRVSSFHAVAPVISVLRREDSSVPPPRP